MQKWKLIIQRYGICVISLGILGGMGIAHLLKPDEKISQQEQRTLQQLPSFKVSSFLNKDFQKETEQYLQDQLPARNILSQGKVKLEHRLGKSQFSSVLIGDEDMLFQETTIPDTTKNAALSKQIKAFMKRYPKVNMTMLLSCNKQEIYADQLPFGAEKIDQSAQIQEFYGQLGSRMKTIDVKQTFQKHAKEELFYKSDHHWTTRGAYLAFQEYYKIRLKQQPTYEYETYTVSDSFVGALARTSGYISKQKDHLEVYLPKKKTVDTVVNYMEEQKKSASLYDYDKALTTDPYEVFLGGNHARIDLTTNVKNNQRLLVIKDSFANSFLPFLVPYYHEIIVIDPRYYFDDLATLMKEQEITDVLFLYNANTLFADTALHDMFMIF